MNKRSETKTNQRGFKIDFMVKKQVSVRVNFLTRFGQGYFGIVATVPFTVDAHIRNIVSAHSATVVHNDSVQFVGLVRARKVELLGVDNPICQFYETVVLVPEPFQVQLSKYKRY